MKKIISASSYSVSSDDYNTFLEQLDYKGYHYNYEMEMPPGNKTGLSFKFVPTGDKSKYLPIIEVRTEEEDGNLYFVPSMVFPERIDGGGLAFADSFEYYMDGYVEAGKLCTQILKSVYTPGMYSDD